MILLFDTSTPTGYLALGDGTNPLATATWQAEQSHSRMLPPQIECVLGEAGLTVGALTHIAVGIGPGSFTGLRVALATAKGLGISLGIPIIAVPTLKLFAAGCRATTPTVVATTDAFRGEIYIGIYKVQGIAPNKRTCRQLREAASMTPRDAVEILRDLKAPFFVTGTGLARCEALFANALGPFPSATMDDPDFSRMLEVAGDYIREERFSDPAALLPYYVRHAEAVEKGRQG